MAPSVVLRVTLFGFLTQVSCVIELAGAGAAAAVPELDADPPRKKFIILSILQLCDDYLEMQHDVC
jgi:hypothetical protein